MPKDLPSSLQQHGRCYRSAFYVRKLQLPSGHTNALTETTIGLYKTECIRADSPFRHGPIRTLADLEEITSAWIHWYNTRRLMHRLGRIPPAEAETAYYAATDAATPAASHTN